MSVVGRDGDCSDDGALPGFLVFDFGSSMSSRQLRCTMRQTPLCKIHMWRSSGLQLDVRLVIRGEGKSSKRLVDLVRFELTTSSMPFKKYQSLTDILTQNKGLSGGRFGRRWTPQGLFRGFGLRADSNWACPHPIIPLSPHDSPSKITDTRLNRYWRLLRQQRANRCASR